MISKIGSKYRDSLLTNFKQGRRTNTKNNRHIKYQRWFMHDCSMFLLSTSIYECQVTNAYTISAKYMTVNSHQRTGAMTD